MPSFSRVFAAIFGCFSSKSVRDDEPVEACRPIKVYAGVPPSTPSSTTTSTTASSSSSAKFRRDSAISSSSVAATPTSSNTSTKKEVKISPKFPQYWEYEQKSYRERAGNVQLERFWQPEEPAMRTKKEINHDIKWYGGLHRAENSMKLNYGEEKKSGRRGRGGVRAGA